MKLDYENDKKELLSITLLVISVVFAVLICMKAISFVKLRARANHIENIAQTIKAKDSSSSEDIEKYLGPTKEMANNLKKRNLFAPPQPKTNPVTQIPCILGDEVFINNKWYKEGDMVQDAKIVSVEPTQVTIEWEGKKTVLQPLGAQVTSNGPEGQEGAPPRPEINPSPGRELAVAQTPSQEQPPVPDENINPEVVMIESPIQVESRSRTSEQMIEQFQNIDPAMLKNIPIEQQEQIQKMLKMQMQK